MANVFTTLETDHEIVSFDFMLGRKKSSNPRPSRLSLVALSLGWVMIYADRLSISPLMNLIRQEFNLSYSSVSLLLSIYFFTYVGFTIPAAILAEKFGYKRVMVTFFLITAVSFGFAGLFGWSYYLLLLFLALHGIGAGAYYPTAFKISTSISQPVKRGFSTSILNSGMGLGTILGLAIAGPILIMLRSWQLVFTFLAIPTAITAVILQKSVTYHEDHSEFSSNFRFSIFYELFRNRAFIYICLAMLCSLYGYWVILSWGPSFLQTGRHLSIFYSGLATGLFAAIAVPGSILMGKYSDKFGRRTILILSFPLASLTIMLMGVAQNLQMFILAIVAYGVIGQMSLNPVAIAWVGDLVSSPSLGTALAVLNVFAMASSILAPLVTGLVADTTGTLSYGFVAGSIVVLTGTVFLFLVTKK